MLAHYELGNYPNTQVSLSWISDYPDKMKSYKLKVRKGIHGTLQCTEKVFYVVCD